MALKSWLEGLEIEPDGTSMPYDIVPKNFRLHFPPEEKDFPHCCEDHLASFHEIKEWANVFLPEEDAQRLAKKTLLNLSNTESFILFTFNQDDWYEEISEFIEYNIFSFGSSINHAERYLSKLLGFMRSIQIPNNYHKGDKLSDLTFIWLKNSMFSRDLLHLRRTFDRWFYTFPFELSFLKDLKDKYDLFFGIVNGDFIDFDETAFMTEINKMTDAILYNHNTSILHKQGLITDPAKLKFELIASQRTYKLNNENFYGQNSDSDPEYRRMIQKWFKDEIKFITYVSKLNAPKAAAKTEVKDEQFQRAKKQKFREVVPITFESMFRDQVAANASLEVLRKLEKPVINESNVYVGKNKGIIPIWIRMLKSYPDLFISNLTEIEIKDILNQKIINLELSKDASEFRKVYKRLDTEELILEMKTIFSKYSQLSKFSQSSQQGKVGK